MDIYLVRTKFQVSSIILTNFRQGDIIPPPPRTPFSKRALKEPTQIRVNELFKLGFSISYSEVNRLKKSVVANQAMGNSVRNAYSKVFSHSLRGTMLIKILKL